MVVDSDSLRPHSGYQPSPRFAGAFFFADGTLSRFSSSPLLCLGTGAIQRNCDFLPRVAEHHHDLRSDQNAESRTHNQYDTDSDVMQIARAFAPIAPSGPSSHDPCRCPHIQKNGSGIDDQTSPEGHAAKTKACAPPPNILYRSKSGDVRQAVPRRWPRTSSSARRQPAKIETEN